MTKTLNRSVSNRSYWRAVRAIRCSAITPALLHYLYDNSLDSAAIRSFPGALRRPLSVLAIENAMMWLLQVGVIRREVDGQGLTSRFRVTALGRQALQEPDHAAQWYDYVLNWLARWLA